MKGVVLLLLFCLFSSSSFLSCYAYSRGDDGRKGGRGAGDEDEYSTRVGEDTDIPYGDNLPDDDEDPARGAKRGDEWEPVFKAPNPQDADVDIYEGPDPECDTLEGMSEDELRQMRGQTVLIQSFGPRFEPAIPPQYASFFSSHANTIAPNTPNSASSSSQSSSYSSTNTPSYRASSEREENRSASRKQDESEEEDGDDINALISRLRAEFDKGRKDKQKEGSRESSSTTLRSIRHEDYEDGDF